MNKRKVTTRTLKNCWLVITVRVLPAPINAQMRGHIKASTWPYYAHCPTIHEKWGQNPCNGVLASVYGLGAMIIPTWLAFRDL